ncbi:hypothetical protein FA13DRAFT_1739465 [Coprinellus micaceus]|uniref:Uncharacterized protein n=1 Tax=Coprinellus micaceus TaxID=71717 RepID=A0A4Y7SR24_COPMI|nr:hypothetical protein FA13DRAFT_1739465 [Coprinellus micaceus]
MQMLPPPIIPWMVLALAWAATVNAAPLPSPKADSEGSSFGKITADGHLWDPLFRPIGGSAPPNIRI